MQLTFAPNSPYVRKVLVLSIELGLDDRIERAPVVLSPYEPNPVVINHNPLGKIPVLVADDGMPLFDSIVACEYLSTMAEDSTWFPPAGPTRWQALRMNALADGLLEAGQLVRLEEGRPEAFRYQKWIDAQTAKMKRALDSLNRHLPAEQDIGAIAVSCALSWLDLRFPALSWRGHSPRLAQWADTFGQRASFVATQPPG